MLKKILMLALILNTPYILPSNSATNPYNTAAICTIAGIICTWFAYKDLIKGWPAQTEVFRQIDILHEMGCKVYKVSKLDVEWDSLVVREHYKIEIPSLFSQEQKKKANEHWNLLLTNDKYSNNMLGWPAVGSAILLPIGIGELWKVLASTFRFQ